jgi:hypothetical protein
MHRSLLLLVLPLLVAGCHSSSAPTATIDSYRASYFSGQQLPTPSQVAAMPSPDPASLAPDAASDDQPAANAKPDAKTARAAAAPPKKAGPPAYKASVAAYIKRYAVDSNSLKLAKISAPFPGSVNGEKGSVVCVALGGASDSRTAYLLKDNAVADSELGAQSCQGKQLQPWDDTGA